MPSAAVKYVFVKKSFFKTQLKFVFEPVFTPLLYSEIQKGNAVDEIFIESLKIISNILVVKKYLCLIQ